MRLTVWLPPEVLLDEEVARIRAQAVNGSFGMLPKHVDFVTALVPGVLTFQADGKPEEYLAVDHGILVKCGPQVRISTRHAARGATLAELKMEVDKQFQHREESEKKARAFEAKLETDLVRRLLEAEKLA
jgi:F-type H+-transporting ATPase subunit epsilon